MFNVHQSGSVAGPTWVWQDRLWERHADARAARLSRVAGWRAWRWPRWQVTVTVRRLA